MPAHGATLMLDYIRDGQEIYRNSFAIIREEARLERIPADLEKLAVRVIHACGMVEACLLYTSPSPRDKRQSRMPSSA